MGVEVEGGECHNTVVDHVDRGFNLILNIFQYHRPSAVARLVSNNKSGQGGGRKRGASEGGVGMGALVVVHHVNRDLTLVATTVLVRVNTAVVCPHICQESLPLLQHHHQRRTQAPAFVEHPAVLPMVFCDPDKSFHQSSHLARVSG